MGSIFDGIAHWMGYYTHEEVLRIKAEAKKQIAPKGEPVASAPENDANRLEELRQQIAIEPHQVDGIRYFIAYANATGFGHAEIILSTPIRSYTDLKYVQELVRQEAETVVVLNWQRFESSVPDGGGREDVPVDDKPVGTVLKLVSNG
jgi:hypothetical protein